MPITAAERTKIVEITVAMFGAAPGGYLADLVSLYENVGKNDKAFAIALANSNEFKAPGFFPPYLTAEEVATKMTQSFGLDPNDNGAGKQAYDFFLANLQGAQDVYAKVGELYAQAVDYLNNVAKADPANVFNAAAKALENKTIVAEYYSTHEGATVTDIAVLQQPIVNVNENTDVTNPADVINVNNQSGVVTGEAFTLTADTDVATANVFNAPMVYTPDGSDRILSLQDEDHLTGLADRADNTLNVTMGNMNADEGTTGVVTPYLNNIQNINIDWTGNTSTLDLRNADATQAIHVDRVTQDAGAVTVDNIGTPAADLRVANTASDNVSVQFRYKEGVLASDNDTMSLELNDVLANTVIQDARGAGAGLEGFETVNLTAANGVDMKNLTVNQMETLKITGSGKLKLANLTWTAPGLTTVPEYVALGAAGINNPGAVGLLDLDASQFTGDLTLDITNSLGGFNDPNNSGQTVHGVVTGGSGNDTFWTSKSIAATSATNRDQIDGGAGEDTIVMTEGDIAGNAKITGVETLELRNQPVSTDTHNIDVKAFDAALTKVLMRDEDADNNSVNFNLDNVTQTLAQTGLVLQHSVTETGAAPVVRVRLDDATGASDLVAIRVENSLNTTTQFDYTLNFDGQANGNETIENVSIDDADTETNKVTLSANTEHTGTITLKGGSEGNAYTVTNSMIASVIDASGQKSDLRLTVGEDPAEFTRPIQNITQDIRLGTGNDILTFRNLDDFDNTDSLTDAGGVDTVRAAFSKDSALDLTGIENLHIVATDNVKLDMAKADVENLVILADIAVDGDNDASPVTAEPFNLTGVATTDIITLENTKLNELNFSADLDDDDDNTNDEWTTAIFNGVKLASNTATDLAVNINSALDTVVNGARVYNVGQLTAHGINTMTINVADEYVDPATGKVNAATTINNIYSQTMTALTVNAKGDANVGTVSGNALNNSLNRVDATNVGGDFTATVISLGDNATVVMGDGDNAFSALGSSGKNITITAGDGDNNITGSAQSDTITTGSGHDIVDGDRGDNVITTGAGHDTVTGKDGNDTYDVGSGFNAVIDNYNTGIDASLANNVVAISNGGIAAVAIDVDGGGSIGGADVNQMLAVGEGSNLTVRWTGGALDANATVLDGSQANIVSSASTQNGDANANLYVIDSAVAVTVNGGAGNDVAMVTDSGAILTFNGGDGNDAAVGGGGVDTFTGGAGADVLVMQNDYIGPFDGFADRVVITDGDSTANGWDVALWFDVISGANHDILDLDSTVIATGVAGNDTTTIDAGNTTISSGIITFRDASNNQLFVTSDPAQVTNGISLDEALQFLAQNITGSETVAFYYDGNGNGLYVDAEDSTFVFQDGVNDTVVQLLGVTNNDATSLSTSAALNAIYIA